MSIDYYTFVSVSGYCDRILVPLSEILKVGIDDMPHSFFNYYTYSKMTYQKKVILKGGVLRSTDHGKKLTNGLRCIKILRLWHVKMIFNWYLVKSIINN